MTLKKEMFGTEFEPNKDNPFSLRTGQMRGGDTKMAHNAGWYNLKGERLGWGDLSAEDFLNIQNNIAYYEAFIVLPEQYAFWEFVEKPGIIGSLAETKLDIDEPGKAYVRNHMTYTITPAFVSRVNENYKVAVRPETIDLILVYQKSRSHMIRELELIENSYI